MADLLLTQEVVELLKISPRTVQRWGEAGKLGEVHRLGGSKRPIKAYEREAVLRVRDERREAKSSPASSVSVTPGAHQANAE